METRPCIVRLESQPVLRPKPLGRKSPKAPQGQGQKSPAKSRELSQDVRLTCVARNELSIFTATGRAIKWVGPPLFICGGLPTFARPARAYRSYACGHRVQPERHSCPEFGRKSPSWHSREARRACGPRRTRARQMNVDGSALENIADHAAPNVKEPVRHFHSDAHFDRTVR